MVRLRKEQRAFIVLHYPDRKCNCSSYKTFLEQVFRIGILARKQQLGKIFDVYI